MKRAVPLRRVILAHIHRAMRERKSRCRLGSIAISLDNDIGQYRDMQLAEEAVMAAFAGNKANRQRAH